MSELQRWIGAVLGLSTVLASACGSSRDPSGPAAQIRSADPSEEEEQEPFDSLRGARFRSVDPYPAGMGPDGPVMGHRHLVFSPDGRSFQWTVEDMTCTGGLVVRDGSLHVLGTPFTDGRGFTAELDEQRGVLTWDGVEFERAP